MFPVGLPSAEFAEILEFDLEGVEIKD